MSMPQRPKTAAEHGEHVKAFKLGYVIDATSADLAETRFVARLPVPFETELDERYYMILFLRHNLQPHTLQACSHNTYCPFSVPRCILTS